MKDSIYVVVTRNGVKDTRKTDGFSLKPGERAFRLDIEIPDEVFATPRIPSLRMQIPPEALISEFTVEADFQEGGDG